MHAFDDHRLKTETASICFQVERKVSLRATRTPINDPLVALQMAAIVHRSQPPNDTKREYPVFCACRLECLANLFMLELLHGFWASGLSECTNDGCILKLPKYSDAVPQFINSP